MDERILEAVSTALLTHRNINKGYDNWPEVNRQPYEWATDLMAGLKHGDPKAAREMLDNAVSAYIKLMGTDPDSVDYSELDNWLESITGQPNPLEEN